MFPRLTLGLAFAASVFLFAALSAANLTAGSGNSGTWQVASNTCVRKCQDCPCPPSRTCGPCTQNIDNVCTVIPGCVSSTQCGRCTKLVDGVCVPDRGDKTCFPEAAEPRCGPCTRYDQATKACVRDDSADCRAPRTPELTCRQSCFKVATAALTCPGGNCVSDPLACPSGFVEDASNQTCGREICGAGSRIGRPPLRWQLEMGEWSMTAAQWSVLGSQLGLSRGDAVCDARIVAKRCQSANCESWKPTFREVFCESNGRRYRPTYDPGTSTWFCERRYHPATCGGLRRDRDGRWRVNGTGAAWTFTDTNPEDRFSGQSIWTLDEGSPNQRQWIHDKGTDRCRLESLALTCRRADGWEFDPARGQCVLAVEAVPTGRCDRDGQCRTGAGTACPNLVTIVGTSLRGSLTPATRLDRAQGGATRVNVCERVASPECLDTPVRDVEGVVGERFRSAVRGSDPDRPICMLATQQPECARGELREISISVTEPRTRRSAPLRRWACVETDGDAAVKSCPADNAYQLSRIVADAQRIECQYGVREMPSCPADSIEVGGRCLIAAKA